MKTALRTMTYFLLGNRPVAFAAFVATYAPHPVRHHLLIKLGIQNRGTIGRRVRFVNRAVVIGRGAHIGNGCRFEGGAVITIGDGVSLPPRTVITTAAMLNDGLTYDRPVTVVPSSDNKTGFVISGVEKQA